MNFRKGNQAPLAFGRAAHGHLRPGPTRNRGGEGGLVLVGDGRTAGGGSPPVHRRWTGSGEGDGRARTRVAWRVWWWGRGRGQATGRGPSRRRALWPSPASFLLAIHARQRTAGGGASPSSTRGARRSSPWGSGEPRGRGLARPRGGPRRRRGAAARRSAAECPCCVRCACGCGAFQGVRCSPWFELGRTGWGLIWAAEG